MKSVAATTPTAAAYARQSKTDEEELAVGASLSSETQIAKAEQFAALHGWRFDKELSLSCVDLDTSGGAKPKHRKTGIPSWQRRPGLMRLYEAARSGQLQHLIVYKLDRLGRDAAELHQIRDAFHDAGAVIHIVSESIRSDTPSGELVFGILSSVAQMERRQISDRIRDVSLQRARRGLPHRMPGWLMIVPDTRPGDGPAHYDLHPVHAQTLLRLVALRLSGLSYSDICRTLNREGLTTSRGAIWTRCSIQDMLSEHNRLLYRGYSVYGLRRPEGDPLRIVTPNAFPALLDADTADALDATQSALIATNKAANYQSAAKKAGIVLPYRHSEMLCAGMFRCAICGAAMICKRANRAATEGNGETLYHFYYCRQSNIDATVTHPGAVRTNRKGGMALGGPKIDAAVLRGLDLLRRELKQEKTHVKAQKGKTRPIASAALLTGEPAPKRTAAEITAAIDTLLEMVESGRLKAADYDRRYAALDRERQEAEAYLARVAAQGQQERALQKMVSHPAPLDDWDIQDLRLLLRLLCERVEAPVFVEGALMQRNRQGGDRVGRAPLEHVRLVLKRPLPGGETAILAAMYRNGYQGEMRVFPETPGVANIIDTPEAQRYRESKRKAAELTEGVELL